MRKEKEKNPVIQFGNNPIYPLLSTWISTWTLYEYSSLRTIQSLQMKSFGPKFFQISCMD
jgi:hypothetical protein